MMLKLCPSKRPAAQANKNVTTNPFELYYGKRPSGSAPFDVMNAIFDWSKNQHRIRAEYYAAYPKYDGFQVVIDRTGVKTALRSKRGADYSRFKGRLAAMDGLMRERFAPVIKQCVTHPTAGEAIRLYAEVVCDTGDGDDLQALMHGRPNPTHLLVFDCDFARSSIRIPLPDKLTLLRQHIGEKYVVPTLFDARHPVTEAQLEALKTCMVQKEGIIVEFRGRKLKHKISLPVPLHLLGVGFTTVQSVSIPSHFVWAVQTARTRFEVVFMDDRSYLCDPVRKQENKMHIDPFELVGMTCVNDTFIGKNYHALLAMVKTTLIDTTKTYSDYEVHVAGNVYTIDRNRSFHFGMAAFKFLPTPAVGVIGGNTFWLTGRGTSPGSVHIQAPQFLASLEYGHPIYRMLVPGYTDAPKIPPLSAENFVLLASFVRDARVHAEIVYGPDVRVDLVLGVYERIEEEEPLYVIQEHLCSNESDDDSPYNTPQHSDDEDACVYRAKVWEYENGRRVKIARVEEIKTVVPDPVESDGDSVDAEEIKTVVPDPVESNGDSVDAEEIKTVVPDPVENNGDLVDAEESPQDIAEGDPPVEEEVSPYDIRFITYNESEHSDDESNGSPYNTPEHSDGEEPCEYRAKVWEYEHARIL